MTLNYMNAQVLLSVSLLKKGFRSLTDYFEFDVSLDFHLESPNSIDWLNNQKMYFFTIQEAFLKKSRQTTF